MPRRYRTLLDDYERRLEERLQRKEISEDTKKAYLNDANRLLEALVHSLPDWLLKACVKQRGFRGEYDKVINDLKTIIDARKR